jgi:CheY-like chemotaxis protein
VKDCRSLPRVVANEAHLSQVFLNLLTNAAQAIPDGAADHNQIQVIGRVDHQGRVIVEVRDTGRGIPPEHLGRIFEPFFTTKPIGVGTGLGLSIGHGIITALGGTIAVESAVGEGTVVRVTLPPNAVAPALRESPTPTSNTVAGRRGRILIVDDEALLCETMAQALEGHEVVSHTDGHAVLERIGGGERFDVILCDVMMPELTGMELYARVRELAPDQAGRMVFMSGGAFTPAAQEFLESIPNERLDKPFSLDRLVVLVDELLGRWEGLRLEA